MGGQYVDNETLNQIIRGVIKFRKCPSCDQEGIELQAYDMYGEPCKADHPEAHRDVCQDCEGIAFIQIPHD